MFIQDIVVLSCICANVPHVWYATCKCDARVVSVSECMCVRAVEGIVSMSVSSLA